MGSSGGEKEGEEEGGFTVPPGISEEDVVRTVRDILGDEVNDMTEEMIMDFVGSGIVAAVCPEFFIYLKTSSKKNVEEEEAEVEVKEKNVEEEKKKNVEEEQKNVEEEQKNVEEDEKKTNVEEKATAKHSNNSHKKKKKKHKKEQKKKDRERAKVKEEKKEKPKPTPIVSDSSEEDERPKKQDTEEKKKKKKKVVKVVYFSSSSDNDNDKEKNPKQEDEKKAEESSKKKPDDGIDTEPKIHPFSQDRVSGDGGEGSKSSLPSTSAPSKVDMSSKKKPEEDEIDTEPKIHPPSQDRVVGDGGEGSTSTLPSIDTSAPSEDVLPNPKEMKKEIEKTPKKKKLPKPFSKYNSLVSVSSLQKWRPILDLDHLKHQHRFRLKPVSVVCVDLLDLPVIFHHPQRKPKTPVSAPLTSTSKMTFTSTRLEMIKKLEQDKAKGFKRKLNKEAIKFMKQFKVGSSKRYLDSSDDDKKRKKRKIMDDKIVSSRKSKSDSSSVIVMIPGKKNVKEAELKKKKLEEIQEKERAALAETKKRVQKLREEKLAKQDTGTSESLQRLLALAQIDAAKNKEATRSKVELIIPKTSDQNKNEPPTELKVITPVVGVGDVYREVARLLSSEVKVNYPVIPEVVDDLGEYTVKKIAWWLLKNEKDPADVGVWHPELHDDDELESIHEDDFDWPDDMSSIYGCVSDPEGSAVDLPLDRSKINDPDWADEYCGEASLSATMRREKGVSSVNWESTESFERFLKTREGTNYQKASFEVKCRICKTKITGQRQLGAHIRSAAHKDNLRNCSLTLARYEEKVEPVVPKKEFTAKLVEYTVIANATNSAASNTEEQEQSASEEVAHQVGKIERVRSDSPGPIIAGHAAENVTTCQEPIPDDVSFCSMENYDISSDDSLMQVKARIRSLDKWDYTLERRWREWRDKEDKIIQKYNAQREFHIENPTKHPSYDGEWLKFWNRRCDELESQGIDTANYDFNREWMPFWLKRVQEIMKEEVEKEVLQLKKSLWIDKQTLRERFNISAEETKRREKKNRNEDSVDDEPSHSKKHEERYSANRSEHQTVHRSKFHKNYESSQSRHKQFENRNYYGRGKHVKKNYRHYAKEKHSRPRPYHHGNNRDRKRYSDPGFPARSSPHVSIQNWREDGRSDKWRTKRESESKESSRNPVSAWEVDSSPSPEVTPRVATRKEDSSDISDDSDSMNMPPLANKLRELKEALAKEGDTLDW